MTNLVGQCLHCGHKNAESAAKCGRCDSPLTGGHSHDDRQFGSPIPIIIAGLLVLGLLYFGMTRNSAGPALAAGAGVAIAASSGEPPEEELVFGAPSTTAFAQSPSAAPGQGANVQGQWHEVVALDGSGAKRSPTFAINSRHWRIRWKAAPAQEANGWIYSIVYRKTGKSLGMVINSKGESGGVTRMQGRGRYYVEVQSNQNWNLNVEQWN